jgi:hypothetical protein
MPAGELRVPFEGVLPHGRGMERWICCRFNSRLWLFGDLNASKPQWTITQSLELVANGLCKSLLTRYAHSAVVKKHCVVWRMLGTEPPRAHVGPLRQKGRDSQLVGPFGKCASHQYLLSNACNIPKSHFTLGDVFAAADSTSHGGESSAGTSAV